MESRSTESTRRFTSHPATDTITSRSVAQGASKFEVIVTFSTPYADWKALFSPLYPASTNNDPNIFNTGWKDRLLTSAGPFKFQSYDATAKTYTLVAE